MAAAMCTGEVLSQWGAGEFLLPHMITVDNEGNLWTTDVAAHVAIKWSPAGAKLLELGRRGQPGHDKEHLCKPTQVNTSFFSMPSDLPIILCFILWDSVCVQSAHSDGVQEAVIMSACSAVS